MIRCVQVGLPRYACEPAVATSNHRQRPAVVYNGGAVGRLHDGQASSSQLNQTSLSTFITRPVPFFENGMFILS